MPLTDEDANALNHIIMHYNREKYVQGMFDAIRSFPIYDDEDAELRAFDWVAEGFTPECACKWISQGCFCAACAANLVIAGVTPYEAGIPYDYRYEEVFYSDTVGYKYANGEITLQEAIDIIHPNVKRSGDLQ